MNNTITIDEVLKNRWMIDWRWITRHIKLRTVCEVGVGPASISIMRFFQVGGNCQRLIGVEPNPEFHGNVPTDEGAELVPCAVYSETGEMDLLLSGGSSALVGTFMQQGREKITVKCITFDTVDDGEIDALNIDCEGCELYVLEKLKSRPKIIGIETWPHDPNAGKVREWMATNGYTVRLSTGPEGETQIWTNP